MPQVIEIPIEALVIGRGQARTENIGSGIDELADSIKVNGLLQPIVVCKAEQEGKYEVLTGQRRLLAHKLLQRDTIMAMVIGEQVSDIGAKVISLTENVMRKKLTNTEVKDVVLQLYNQYGTIKDVVKKTGLPHGVVRANVKYPRLTVALKKMVDDGEVDINVAIQAQDAATEGDVVDTNDAVTLAKEMTSMTGVQRKRVGKIRFDNPDKDVSDVIEEAKSGSKISQIVLTLTQDTHHAIQKYAKEDKKSVEEASTELIEEALIGRGFLSDS